jgi:hypothetical protein
MIDEILNKIPSKLTDMLDPSTKATLPRVEDIRPGRRRHTKTNIGANSKGAKRK